jgi:hypothetical protein
VFYTEDMSRTFEPGDLVTYLDRPGVIVAMQPGVGPVLLLLDTLGQLVARSEHLRWAMTREDLAALAVDRAA